jgi:hypothetical protein
VCHPSRGHCGIRQTRKWCVQATRLAVRTGQYSVADRIAPDRPLEQAVLCVDVLGVWGIAATWGRPTDVGFGPVRWVSRLGGLLTGYRSLLLPAFGLGSVAITNAWGLLTPVPLARAEAALH